MKTCKELFNEILNIPFERLNNVGDYTEDPNVIEFMNGIDYHGLKINIVLDLEHDILKIELNENDQDCFSEFSCKLESSIIESFDDYIVKHDQYCEKKVIEYFELCVEKDNYWYQNK